MGLFNNIFKWLILDRVRQIEYFNSWPFEVQGKVLQELIEHGRSTEWGLKHHFSKITDYQSFVSQDPIQDYNSLKPFIERMIEGQSNILWDDDILWFSKSSGTTEDKSKFIPVSNQSIQDCHFKAGKDMYSMYYNNNPNAGIINGKTLPIGGSHKIVNVKNNIKCGDLSAILTENLPYWAEAKRVPSKEVALMGQWDEKIEKMAHSVLAEPVTCILGVPTWTVVLIRRIFEITGTNNLKEIWPDLELYIHGGISFEPYSTLFNQFIPKEGMNYLEIYNASEGFFAIQDNPNSDGLLLMLDYGIFYEFIPLDDYHQGKMNAIPLQEVELDINYALVITTNSGLWRYVIGDTIKFITLKPFRIKITGRTSHFINAFGEEVVIENTDKAVAYACQMTDSYLMDYTVCPIYFEGQNGKGGHQWLIEFEKAPKDIQVFFEFLDTKLKSLNSDYEAKRFNDMAIGFPVYQVLKKGTFSDWLRSQEKMGGQHKIPRLSNNRQYVEQILAFKNH